MDEKKLVPESLQDPKFSELTDTDLDSVAGGIEGTYDPVATTTGGGDEILVHRDDTV